MTANRLQIVVNLKTPAAAGVIMDDVAGIVRKYSLVLESKTRQWNGSRTFVAYADPRDSESLGMILFKLESLIGFVNSGNQKVSNRYKIPGVPSMRARIVELGNQ